MRIAEELATEYWHLRWQAWRKMCVIAHDYRIKVDLWYLGEYGSCLWAAPSGWRIAINLDEAPTRRKFSFAHELGHFFLHRNHTRAHFFSCTGQASPRKEREANQFAASLLMPEALILHMVDAGYCHENTARILGLSAEAVSIRYKTLRVM